MDERPRWLFALPVARRPIDRADFSLRSTSDALESYASVNLS